MRNGRQPFTFYRGAALLVAADLSRTPRSDLIVQLCGDAHLSTSGCLASPERRLVFDVNDVDETNPGPLDGRPWWRQCRPTGLPSASSPTRPTWGCGSRRSLQDSVTRAYSRDSMAAQRTLTERVDGRLRIINDPPVVVPAREMDHSRLGVDDLDAWMEGGSRPP